MLIGGLVIALVLTVLLGVMSGPAEVTVSEALAALFASDGSSGAESVIVRDIRLPRVLTGLLVGAGLTIAGAMLQGLFRNPLADPALIGVSSGAAMGGVTAIVLVPVLWSHFAPATPEILSLLSVPMCAMLGAVGLTFLIYKVSLVGGKTHVASMLLTGIAVNAIAGAFVGLMITVFASDAQLRSVTFWMLGSLAGATWQSTLIVALIIVPGVLLSLRHARALNAFLLGEVEAFHLGVPVQRVKRAVIILSALMVGVTVAFCGVIGFVALVVPHIIRISFGPDHKLLLPAGALFGGIVLVVADILARILIAPAELQIGILTALVGGPFFLGLLIAGRKKMAL